MKEGYPETRVFCADEIDRFGGSRYEITSKRGFL
jgi:hypothetical protein